MRKIKKAYIEITNKCNLACPFCPGTRRPTRFMSPTDFAGIVDKLRGKIGCLYFHVMGEPLLHPDLSALLDIADGAKLPVNLTTNGTLFDQAGEMLLGKPALRQVNVSLHSQGHENGAYMDSVLHFVRAAHRDGRVIVALRFWNVGAVQNEMEERIRNRLAAEFGLEASLEGAKGDSRGVRLAQGVYFNRATPFQWPGIECEDLGTRGFCMGLRDQIAVLVDGTVVPCCLDGEGAVPLGNLKLQTLDEMLASERATALYDGFTRRQVVEQLCRRCGYRKRFD